jgi:hypothetical protein
MTLLRASFALALGLLLGSASAGVAADTITGEVVDLACYMGHGEPEKMRGPGHRKCADMCLKKGMPIGIVTDEKQVFLVLEDHDNPKPYAQLKEKAAERVTIEGTKTSVGGNQGFVIESLK